MRFGSNVIMFEAFSVPMVGNAATSYLIGLTSEGAEVCRRMLAEDVSEEEVAAVDAHLPEHLQRGGFLESRERSCSLQSAYLHVTQACNLDCVGCYSCDEQRNRSEDLPLEALCAIVDELGRRGVSRLVISGGEPFLRDDLAALVRHAKEQAGIGSIDVLTNGTCISAEKLAALAPYVDRVSVSFDGASADAPSPSAASSASTSWWRPSRPSARRASRRTSSPPSTRATWLTSPPTAPWPPSWEPP